ncbi:GNAT family N-acetyltransferase [Methylobacterium sp. BTF04]|uniref:GNAT family N-acetyltransferase n=1 Tax=Methylobacterium sp. BTF04 TaxID=2708300 RepID=UPI0013D42714|nr:GNAT family N-acetyltransferase [Methylobacterium sp. BTF04]NEU10717.1 GNAT family N-acetyltransferase [Methylobacterium sp. BTF04]
MGSRYGLEIRAAQAADAAGLAQLLAEAGRPQPAERLADSLDALRAGHGVALIALEWGPPSGLVVLHWYRTLEEVRPVAQITTLLVGPEQRRRGIGRMLLKAASQAARNAECDTLQVLAPPDRPDLQGFCVATGFAESGTSLVRPLRKGR